MKIFLNETHIKEALVEYVKTRVTNRHNVDISCVTIKSDPAYEAFKYPDELGISRFEAVIETKEE